MRERRVFWVCLVALFSVGIVGCAAKPDVNLVNWVDYGEFGQARVYLQRRIAEKGQSYRKNRNFVLDRMRLVIVGLADGYPFAVARVFDDLFETLTVQGLNKDKTVASVMINEGVKVWKGEPFEQALAFHYLAVGHAMLGSWDNARASIANALFHLRDFGNDEKGNRLDGEGLTRKAAKTESANKEDYLATGYAVVESNFALGYLITAVANQQLARATGDADRKAEADDNYAKVLALDSGLEKLVSELKQDDYNTLLVVDYGRGPRKIGTGPDKAIAKFDPLTRSDRAALQVTVNGVSGRWPVVCDVNQMAQDHMWNNLEDVRVAKSLIGTALLGAGIGQAAGGSDTDLMVGGALALVGVLAKASAHADTRYCEVVPQRVYVVPVNVRSENTSIALELVLPDGGMTRMLLTGFRLPSGNASQIRYVRLTSEKCAPRWAYSGKILYHNDACTPDEPGLSLPYILGGRCVCRPTAKALRRYQTAGFLEGVSLEELEDLYRLEGIDIASDARGKDPGKHILEGGNSLVLPLRGTPGFSRLLGQIHQPYKPKSEEVKRLAASIKTLLQPAPEQGAPAVARK